MLRFCVVGLTLGGGEHLGEARSAGADQHILWSCARRRGGATAWAISWPSPRRGGLVLAVGQDAV